MNKKVFLIPIVIGILLALLFKDCSGEKAGLQYKVTTPAAPNQGKSNIKGVHLYLDNSGSMRGYVDFGGNNPEFKDAQKSILATLGTFLNNMNSIYAVEPACYCGGKSYTIATFRKNLQDNTIFSGPVTFLDAMIAKACQESSDSMLSVVVSDMVLSFGKQKLILKKDSDYNAHALPELGDALHAAFNQVKNKQLELLLVQFYSDYNGTYYCNYRENLSHADQYKKHLMTERPYYALFIGSKKNLRSVMAANIFNGMQQHIYASFDIEDKIDQDFTVENAESSWYWGENIAKPDSSKTGTLCLDYDNGKDEEFFFRCKSFHLPRYIDDDLVVEWDSQVVRSAKYDKEGSDGRVSVTLKKYADLPKGFTDNVHVSLKNRFDWVKEAHTLDDVAIGGNLTNLKRKTWGIATLVESIDKAFHRGKREPQEIVRFRFAVNVK